MIDTTTFSCKQMMWFSFVVKQLYNHVTMKDLSENTSQGQEDGPLF